MSNIIDAPKLAEPFKEKLSKIKVCLFDVDGILTDGRIYWGGEEVGYNRFFHVHDGYGIKILRKAGVKVGVITGGDSRGVIERFNLLGLDYFFFGNEDKREALNKILSDAQVTTDEVLYMGDEFFDLPVLKQVGFAATVPNASQEIKAAVDYVTQRESGRGCVREVIDMLRSVQNIVPHIEF